jgi:hypothetical protein
MRKFLFFLYRRMVKGVVGVQNVGPVTGRKHFEVWEL